jgi:hypothetical protein
VQAVKTPPERKSFITAIFEFICSCWHLAILVGQNLSGLLVVWHSVPTHLSRPISILRQMGLDMKLN